MKKYIDTNVKDWIVGLACMAFIMACCVIDLVFHSKDALSNRPIN
jgi:hypothetical protein